MWIADAQPRFRDQIAHTLDDALSGHAAPVSPVSRGRLDIRFDFGPIATPDPATHQMHVAYLLVLSCRSPLLSPPRIAVNDIIFDGYPSEQQVRHAVRRSLEALLGVREQMLSPTPPGGPVAAQGPN